MSSPLAQIFQLAGVKLIFPFSNDNGGNAVADEIGKSAPLRHETVNAENKRQAGDRNARDNGQGGR